MKKKITALLALSLAAVMLLPGCRQGSSRSSESEVSASTVDSVEKPQPTQATTAPAVTAPATFDTPPSTEATQPQPPTDAVDDSKITYNTYEIKRSIDEIDATLDNLLDYHGYSGVVYVKFGNDYEALRERGVANKGAHINNSLHTCVYSGELTHLITAVAMMQLKEKNGLDFDTAIDKYFPGCAYAGEVTIEQLLTESSGIPDYVYSDPASGEMKLLSADLADKVSGEATAAENEKAVLDWILAQNRSPVNAFSPSNSNFFLLGKIIEKESGKTYEDYINDNIFRPLYMTKSGFKSDESTSKPYTGTEETQKLLYEGVGYSALGWVTNVSDIIKLQDGLMTGSIVSETSFKELFSDYGSGYGCGVSVSGIRVTAVGSVDAYKARFSFTTNNNQIFIALTNDSGSDPDEIHRLFRDYLVKFRN